MIELYLTRHGETIENAQHILQGITPGHLSETGIQQAHQLCEQLASIHFDAFISSDLQRAVDTINIVATPHNIQKIIHTPLLRERDWGIFSGRPAIDARTYTGNAPTFVETDQQLQERAHQFLSWLLSTIPDRNRVLAIGHGYFNRCIVAEHIGIIPHDVPRWGNTEIRILQITNLNNELTSRVNPTLSEVSEN